MTFPELIVDGIVKSSSVLEKISPLLAVTRTGEPPAWEQWMKIQGSARIERLLQKVNSLEAENKKLIQRLEDSEKYSPGSGYTKALQEYITSPLEDKIELLQNALLNGFYGDYTLELREQFYRMVIALQPLDIRVLRYLTEKCADIDYYRATASSEGIIKPRTEEIIWETSIGRFSVDPYMMNGPEYREGGLNRIAKEWNIPIQRIVEALDRLRTQALFCNPIVMMDFQDPYHACIPTVIARQFLDFLSDPRNTLKGD